MAQKRLYSPAYYHPCAFDPAMALLEQCRAIKQRKDAESTAVHTAPTERPKPHRANVIYHRQEDAFWDRRPEDPPIPELNRDILIAIGECYLDNKLYGHYRRWPNPTLDLLRGFCALICASKAFRELFDCEYFWNLVLKCVFISVDAANQFPKLYGWFDLPLIESSNQAVPKIYDPWYAYDPLSDEVKKALVKFLEPPPPPPAPDTKPKEQLLTVNQPPLPPPPAPDKKPKEQLLAINEPPVEPDYIFETDGTRVAPSKLKLRMLRMHCSRPTHASRVVPLIEMLHGIPRFPSNPQIFRSLIQRLLRLPVDLENIWASGPGLADLRLDTRGCADRYISKLGVNVTGVDHLVRLVHMVTEMHAYRKYDDPLAISTEARRFKGIMEQNYANFHACSYEYDRSLAAHWKKSDPQYWISVGAAIETEPLRATDNNKHTYGYRAGLAYRVFCFHEKLRRHRNGKLPNPCAGLFVANNSLLSPQETIETLLKSEADPIGAEFIRTFSSRAMVQYAALQPVSVSPITNSDVIVRDASLTEPACPVTFAAYTTVVVFEKYLLYNDPFLLYTVSSLAKVSKTFSQVFGPKGQRIWAHILRLFIGDADKSAYYGTQELGCTGHWLCQGGVGSNSVCNTIHNRAALLSQLGIDWRTDFIHPERDLFGSSADVNSLRASMLLKIGAFITEGLSNTPPHNKVYDEPAMPSSPWLWRNLLVLYIGLFYRLPQNRVFAFLNTDLFGETTRQPETWALHTPTNDPVGWGTIQATLVGLLPTSNKKQGPPGEEHLTLHARTSARPTFDFSGTLTDFISVLIRSEIDCESQMYRLKAQRAAYVSLIRYIFIKHGKIGYATLVEPVHSAFTQVYYY